ncbi:MAG: S1C family serine protease [Patescibacteria group bacterium]
MKPKISPTSPKVDSKHQQEIKKFYEESLKTIDKPSRPRTSSMWFLLLVIFFGFIAGFLAPIVLISYGSDIPILNRLGIFTYPLETRQLVVGNRTVKFISSAEAEKITDAVLPSIVQIFSLPAESDGDENVFVSRESVGSGYILTNDGFIVTSKKNINDSARYAVTTYDGVTYDVVGIITDPSTDMAFLKINASGLNTTALDTASGVNQTEDVIVIKPYGFGKDVLVAKSSIAGTHYDDDYLSATSTQRAEDYRQSFLLSNAFSNQFDGSIAFSFDEEAIGTVSVSEGESVIVPFNSPQSAINQILKTGAISRPYLGLQYVDLTRSHILDTTLTQGYSQGALIHSYDEQNSPSITEGSPADRVGVKAGDIITAVNGMELNADENLSSFVLQHQPGDLITLDVSRSGEMTTLKITLEEQPQ